MRRLLFLLALGASAPALAQHEHHDHSPPAEPAKAPPAKPVEDPQAAQRTPAPAPAEPDPHAAHRSTAPPPAQDPHGGHPAAPAASADPHAGHGAEVGEGPPVAPPPPGALAGPAHAADAVYGAAEMEAARDAMHEEHGGHEASKLMLDRLEYRAGRGRDSYAWEAQAWWGGDRDKLWLKSDGEGGFRGAPDEVEVQALWSRAVSPFFDLQLGLRHDFRPDPERTYLVAGVQGLAPYRFEVDIAAFVSDEGEVSARAEAEYDLRITQRLILQPRVELQLALQDVPELGVGAGLSSGEAGLRLRYELEPRFAPYLGIEYERGFGDTARFRRAAGEEAGGWRMVAGLRAWF